MINSLNDMMEWKSNWKVEYWKISQRIRDIKRAILHSGNLYCSDLYREWNDLKKQATVMLATLEEIKPTFSQHYKIHKSTRDHMKQFPLSFNSPTVDFHFNKKSLESDDVPTWILKAKGKTFYCRSVTSYVVMNTRTNDIQNSTRGLIRFKHCAVSIDESGNATIKNID